VRALLIDVHELVGERVMAGKASGTKHEKKTSTIPGKVKAESGVLIYFGKEIGRETHWSGRESTEKIKGLEGRRKKRVCLCANTKYLTKTESNTPSEKKCFDLPGGEKKKKENL